jgi:hypothetical protein
MELFPPQCTSNPLTLPKLLPEIPPEVEAPIEACAFLCPLGVLGIATLLAVGLFLATPDTVYTGDFPLVAAPFRSRTPAVVYGTPPNLQFRSRTPAVVYGTPIAGNAAGRVPPTQTGGGGGGIIPAIPVAAAGGYCSFTSDTQVTTDHGEQAMSKLHVGDKVLAYNPKTHKMELQPILHVWTHTDNDLVDLTITTTTTLPHHGTSITRKSEVVHTTSEHPFMTTEQGFVPTSKVKIGMYVLRADGSVGVVTGWKLVHGTQVMYNLEVAYDHTFTVGVGQWVVHNECIPRPHIPSPGELGGHITKHIRDMVGWTGSENPPITQYGDV